MSTAGSSIAKKAVARVILAALDESTAAILRDCFRQFGVQTVDVADDPIPRLQREKFEGCVLRLNSTSGLVLEAIRTSRSNSRMVIYAVGKMKDALALSKYGINAVLDHPPERQAALKTVRGTYLLLVHELRRYVRLPLVSEVVLMVQGRRVVAHSQEISGGGMSLRSDLKLQMGDPVEVTFLLPNGSSVTSSANVCWVRREDNLMGVRFDIQDDRRLAVKQWIEAYLDMA